ncbi:hypothetical protein V3481_008776 [Fusarium oxysporum f. sp. vasinfectum]
MVLEDLGPKSPDAASHDNHADVFLLFDAAQKRDELRIQRDESRRIFATKFEHVIITFFFQEKGSLVECLSRAVLFQLIHEETTTIFSRQGPVAIKDQECLKLFAVVQSDDLVKPLLHLGEI